MKGTLGVPLDHLTGLSPRRYTSVVRIKGSDDRFRVPADARARPHRASDAQRVRRAETFGRQSRKAPDASPPLAGGLGTGLRGRNRELARSNKSVAQKN